MANEFYFKLEGRYSPANINVVPTSIGTLELRANQTGTHFDDAVRTIGTVEESIVWDTDVGNAYWLYVRNLDGTNFIEAGFQPSVYVFKLRPGDFMLVPLTPTMAQLYVKADTASCLMQHIIYEE